MKASYIPDLFMKSLSADFFKKIQFENYYISSIDACVVVRY